VTRDLTFSLVRPDAESFLFLLTVLHIPNLDPNFTPEIFF